MSGCFERGSKDRADKGDERGGETARGDRHRDDAARGDRAGGSATGPLAAPPDPPGVRDPDATIRIALEAEPVHLNPLLAGDAIANRVAMGDVYEGLLCSDGLGGPATPCLAVSATESDGGRTWTFALRRGVRWHDGEPFSADDVVFTYRLLTGADAVPSWLRADFDDLVDVRRADAHTAVLSFRGFRMDRRQALARVPILPRHAFADGQGAAPAALATAPHNRAPIGTGPLRFESWAPGARIRLARWDGYWGEPAGARSIVYEIAASRAHTLRALARGDVDVAFQIPQDEAERADGELIAFGYRRPAYLAAVYNARRPPLDDVRVRRALTMLMDRAGVAKALLGGRAAVVSGPFLPGSPAEDPDIEPLPFDPAAAAALLSARPAVTVLVPIESRTMARVADIWARDAAPHAALTVEPAAYADVLARLREGRFDVVLMAFTSARDLDLYSRFHSRGADNSGGLSDPALDRALEAARAEPDPDARAAAQRRVHRRLHALVPYAFITADVRLGLARRDVGGLVRTGLSARGLWRAR